MKTTCSKSGLLRFISAALCLLGLPLGISAQEHKVYSSVYFTYSLPEFHWLLQSGEDASLSRSAWYLISGTVTDIVFKDEGEDSYLVEFELTDAQWDWFGQLVTYTAHLRLTDSQFRDLISDRSLGPGSGVLSPYSKALFMVRYLGPRTRPNGKLEPAFEIDNFKVY